MLYKGAVIAIGELKQPEELFKPIIWEIVIKDLLTGKYDYDHTVDKLKEPRSKKKAEEFTWTEYLKAAKEKNKGTKNKSKGKVRAPKVKSEGSEIPMKKAKKFEKVQIDTPVFSTILNTTEMQALELDLINLSRFLKNISRFFALNLKVKRVNETLKPMQEQKKN